MLDSGLRRNDGWVGVRVAGNMTRRPGKICCLILLAGERVTALIEAAAAGEREVHFPVAEPAAAAVGDGDYPTGAAGQANGVAVQLVGQTA